VKSIFGAATFCLIAGLSVLNGASDGAERDGASWNEHIRELSLHLEPLLVHSDAISATARGLADGQDSPTLRGLTILRYVGDEYSDCEVADGAAKPRPRGATATHADGCGTSFERLILAVALLRAAGLHANVAASTCAPWDGPGAATLSNRLLPTWRVPGGDYVLLPANATGVDEFLAPTCPWGEWVPLSPAGSRPRPIPEPGAPATIMAFELEHEALDGTTCAEGATPGLRRLRDTVVPRLELGPGGGWPRHFKLRERWPAAAATCADLPLRLKNAGGSLAATLLARGESMVLAVDLRIVAPLSLPGARTHVEALMGALAAIRCSAESIPRAGGIGYHGPRPTTVHASVEHKSGQQEQ
jgi:hypothetical protein